MIKQISDLKIVLEFMMSTIFKEEEQEVQYNDLQCVHKSEQQSTQNNPNGVQDKY